MTAIQAVVLTCGHPHTVSHDSGGRLIECKECRERCVVQAIKITNIQYSVTALPPSLFDDLKAETSGEVSNTSAD